VTATQCGIAKPATRPEVAPLPDRSVPAAYLVPASGRGVMLRSKAGQVGGANCGDLSPVMMLI